ncbi:sensor histidine kinase [Nitrospirota bacterium]
MDRISDNLLIGELKRRLNENKKALKDLSAMTEKLEAVNIKLRESEALKGNFLSNIRNEINNPLTAIIGLSEQVASGVVTPDKAADVAKMIYHEAFELDFQLRNIFMAAELEAGESTLNPAKVDVHTFVSRVIAYFGHKIDEKELTVEMVCDLDDCKEGGAFFVSDPEKLQAICVNLLANAIEFSPNGKKIIVRVWKEDGRLVLSVEDKGVGIETHMQKDIFDRFKQLSSGVRKQHKGHGLGLSIVKSILDLMDGNVKLSSIVGKGTTFTISLSESQYVEGATIFSEEGNEFIFDSDEDVSEGEAQEF